MKCDFIFKKLSFTCIVFLFISILQINSKTITLSKEVLLDKIKGGWAGQTIGCAYGGPTEFCYRGTMIPDNIVIDYPKGHLKYFFDKVPTLYDDLYMDLTFVDVFNSKGLDATAEELAKAYAYADYNLWHANMMGRYNIKRGIMPPESGHWLNNPHADCIDYQIESDFAGLMTPGMPNEASNISDKVGHIMNYGDGWYGGVFIGAMYSLAFVENDIMTIVKKALSIIPEEAKFYQCINDVIKWYEADATDWKKCWQLYNDKWAKDIGCPELVLEGGNIDATMNSAYVVIGLLYGNGDFGKTIDISCRCGQDSDCNPSSAGGILATMFGYSNIPEKWMPNLREVENINFAYTTMSLNKTYEIVNKLAISEILRNGGSEDETSVTINVQEPEKVRLEQSFPNMYPHLLTSGGEYLGTNDAPQNTFVFKGNGIAFHGGITCSDATYEAKLQVTLDGKVDCIMTLCSDYRKKTDVIYWKYALEEGTHTVSFKLLNPKKGANIYTDKVIYYDSYEKYELHAIQPTIISKWGTDNSSACSFDFNNDGIQDIFMAGSNIGTLILKGSGTQTAASAYTKVSTPGNINKINTFAVAVPVDFNRDGMADLVAFDAEPTSVVSAGDNGTEGIFIGDGKGHFFNMSNIKIYNEDETIDESFSFKLIKSADVADFNNDGLLDLVASSDRTGYNVVLINNGTDEEGAQLFQKIVYDDTNNSLVKYKGSYAATAYVKAYDLNSDGYMDFVLFGPTVGEKCYFFINNPNKPSTFTLNTFPMYRTIPSFDIADVNNDGYPDIYFSGEYDSGGEGWKNRIYTPVIKGNSVSYKLLCTLPWQNNDVCMGFRSTAFVDWNGDGFTDVIETGRSDTDVDGKNLDSRASKIRINIGDGFSWEEPILTIGSNHNTTILTDFNNDGIVDYARNGTNDLAVNITDLKYSTGNIFSVTVNPNIPTYKPQPPLLNNTEVADGKVTLSWKPAENSIGNETYEYVVFNSKGEIVAGTGMSIYPTGERKTFTYGNACQAKKITLSLPVGEYTYGIQTISTGYQASPFATGKFEIITSVKSTKKQQIKNDTTYYNINGIISGQDANGILLTSDGVKFSK